MTTPGGVPNLPVGALTLDTLASKTQDMSTPAMKARAAERFPSIMDGSTGLSPLSELTPFGILTTLFSGFNSTVANADPNDIQGPEDLPGLLIDFIESLPVVGQFVELLEAIIGGYEGEDEVLQALSAIFAPIRKLLQLLTGGGDGDGYPSVGDVTSGFLNLLNLDNLLALITGADDDEDTGLPHTFPFSFPSDSPVAIFFRNLRKWLPLDFLSGELNLVDMATEFIENFLKPQNLLAWLVPGGDGNWILPDILAPQLIYDVVDAIGAALSGIPVVGGVLGTLWDHITSMLGLTQDAQDATNANSVEVAGIKTRLDALTVAGGVTLIDDFAVSAGPINTTLYHVTYRGTGGGSAVYDGKGNLGWAKTGGGVRAYRARRQDSMLATTYQTGILNIPTRMVNNANIPVARIQLRMNSAETSWVEAQWWCQSNGRITAEIGYVVSSVYTRLGAQVTNIVQGTGDNWEFWAGTTAAEREFVFLRNGSPVFSRLEVGTTSVSNAGTNGYAGFDLTSGTDFFFQIDPPLLGVAAFGDRAI